MKNLPIKLKGFSGVLLWSLLAAAGIAATVWFWQFLNEARQELARQEQELLQMPALEAKASATRSDVAKQQLDIQRIEAFIVQKDQLAATVSEIISAGEARAVRVEVPTVEEKIALGDDGKEKSKKGPLYEVRLKITATGEPKDLLAFLHDVEHMQRLTYFESWRLDAGEETARNQAAALGEATTPDLKALLLADLIVAVRQEEAD